MVIVAVVLLLGGGLLTFLMFQGQNSPTATLQRFCDGYKNHDSRAVYNTLSTSYQKVFKLPMIQQILNSQKGVKVDCMVSDVQQRGETATGTLTVTSPPLGGRDKPPFTRYSKPTLVVENGQWKISNLGS